MKKYPGAGEGGIFWIFGEKLIASMPQDEVVAAQVV
jgi:hypothetical protein